jgi:hypothetical protein
VPAFCGAISLRITRWGLLHLWNLPRVRRFGLLAPAAGPVSLSRLCDVLGWLSPSVCAGEKGRADGCGVRLLRSSAGVQDEDVVGGQRRRRRGVVRGDRGAVGERVEAVTYGVGEKLICRRDGSEEALARAWEEVNAGRHHGEVVARGGLSRRSRYKKQS